MCTEEKGDFWHLTFSGVGVAHVQMSLGSRERCWRVFVCSLIVLKFNALYIHVDLF
jgi:hypothetical protein